MAAPAGAVTEVTGWSAEELAIIRQWTGTRTPEPPQFEQKREPVPDRLPAKPGQPSIENPEVWPAQLMGVAMEPRWPPEQLGSTKYKPPSWRPKPEPLEAPDELSYERIVRLEWECELRSGTINDWYRDVGQAQAADLEHRREVVRRDSDAGERRVGRVGSGRAGGWWIRSTSDR